MYIFYVGYLGSLSCPEIGFFSGLFQACGISPRVEFPQVEIPRVDIPRVEFPRVEFPHVERQE